MAIREEQLGKFFVGETEVSEKVETKEAVEYDFEKALEEKKKQEEMWATKDLKPFGPYILVEKYTENPYQEKYTDEGILKDVGGLHKSADSGNFENYQKGLMCGKVLEVGREECKIPVGSDVIYSNLVIPFPFMGHKNLFLVNEGAVYAIIK